MYTVGQRLVCVDDQFSPAIMALGYRQLPTKGVEYTVRQMLMGRDWIAVVDAQGRPVDNPDKMRSAEPALLLNELLNPTDPLCAGRELAFRATRFAPLEEVDFPPVEIEEERVVPAQIVPERRTNSPWALGSHPGNS